jgi:hypothetical protein
VKRIVWTDPARTDVRSLSKPAAMHILSALHRFVESGAGGGGVCIGRATRWIGRHGAARLRFHSFSCKRAYKSAADLRYVERFSPTSEPPLDTAGRVPPLRRIKRAREQFFRKRLGYSPQVLDNRGVRVVWQSVGQTRSPGGLAPRSESIPYCCALNPGKGIKLVRCQAPVRHQCGNAPNFCQHCLVRFIFQPSDFELCHVRSA